MTSEPGRPGGVVPVLTGQQLLAAVPGLDHSGITIEAHDFRHVPGASLTIGDVIDLAAAIAQRIAAGAAGAVGTQATDALDETACLLDLPCTGPAPVPRTRAVRN